MIQDVDSSVSIFSITNWRGLSKKMFILHQLFTPQENNKELGRYITAILTSTLCTKSDVCIKNKPLLFNEHSTSELLVSILVPNSHYISSSNGLLEWWDS